MYHAKKLLFALSCGLLCTNFNVICGFKSAEQKATLGNSFKKALTSFMAIAPGEFVTYQALIKAVVEASDIAPSEQAAAIREYLKLSPEDFAEEINCNECFFPHLKSSFNAYELDHFIDMCDFRLVVERLFATIKGPVKYPYVYDYMNDIGFYDTLRGIKHHLKSKKEAFVAIVGAPAFDAAIAFLDKYIDNESCRRVPGSAALGGLAFLRDLDAIKSRQEISRFIPAGPAPSFWEIKEMAQRLNAVM